MRKIRTVIVDDEESSREVLRQLLGKFCPEIEIIGECSNIDEAYTIISSKKPDLVFLDVHMPTGNGFTLLKKFATIEFDIIFATSYDKYAISAVRFSALDYLVKPIEVSDLQQA